MSASDAKWYRVRFDIISPPPPGHAEYDVYAIDISSAIGKARRKAKIHMVGQRVRVKEIEHDG